MQCAASEAPAERGGGCHDCGSSTLWESGLAPPGAGGGAVGRSEPDLAPVSPPIIIVLWRFAFAATGAAFAVAASASAASRIAMARIWASGSAIVAPSIWVFERSLPPGGASAAGVRCCAAAAAPNGAASIIVLIAAMSIFGRATVTSSCTFAGGGMCTTG